MFTREWEKFQQELIASVETFFKKDSESETLGAGCLKICFNWAITQSESPKSLQQRLKHFTPSAVYSFYKKIRFDINSRLKLKGDPLDETKIEAIKFMNELNKDARIESLLAELEAKLAVLCKKIERSEKLNKKKTTP